MKIKSVHLCLLKLNIENYSFENYISFFSILIEMVFLKI